MIGSGIRLVVTRHHAEDFKREPQKQWRSHGKLNENGEKTEEEDFGNRIPGSQDCQLMSLWETCELFTGMKVLCRSRSGMDDKHEWHQQSKADLTPIFTYTAL